MKVLLFVIAIVCAHYASSLPVDVPAGKRQYGAISRQQRMSTCGALLTNRNILINDFEVVARLGTSINRAFSLQLFSSSSETSGLPLIKARFDSGPEMDLRRLRLHVTPGSCDDLEIDEIREIAKTRHYEKGTTSAQMRFTLGDNVRAPDTPRACCNLCAYVQPTILNAEDGTRIRIRNKKIEQSLNQGKLICRKGSRGDFLCDLPDLCLHVLRGTDGDDVLIGTPYNDHILGLGGNDRIIGGDGADYLNGGDGDDLIRGGSGNDLVLGSAGNDNLKGGGGRDRLVGGDGDDYIGDSSSYSQGNSSQFGGGAVSDDNLAHGGYGDDTIVMGDGNDFLEGGPGNDTLSGGSGDDVMIGRSGMDILMGGDGDDLVHGDLGAVILKGFDRYADGGLVYSGYPAKEDGFYFPKSSDKLYGGNGNDYLVGGDEDLFYGGGDPYDKYAPSYIFDYE